MTVHHLPAPPNDQELYWYFGPQRRWVLLCTSLAFVLTAATMLTFALRTPALWGFLAVLALNVLALALSSANSLRTRRLTRQSHEVLVRAWQPTDGAPSVDLYLPTCGEPLDVLANAYRAVAAAHWPGRLAVWVLDDADRGEVAALAAEFGFEYVVRPDRGAFKKAGNLNHALTLSDGELIAILDADFAPRPDFLHHLVPYFADPAIGIVQSPQCFDTDASMNWIERAAGSAQEWFFRWIQPSRDASDAAICCGSNAVYRRSALAAAGGFARLDHSEDLYTGLALHEQGFRTLYVPVLVAKGTSPDSLASFVNQQYRWAMGNLHLLTSRDLGRIGAPWRMRLCFYEGIVGYLTMAVNIFAAPLPPLVMLYCYPSQVRPWHVLPLLAPLWLWHVLLPRVSRTRWRVEVIRANVLMSIAAGAAFLHTLRGRTAAWVPTGAGTARPGGLARRVVLVSLLWTAGSLLATAAGLARAVADQGWETTWGLGLYLVVQAQIGLPLVRDLLAELRPRRERPAPATAALRERAAALLTRREPAAGVLPRRWPESLAVTAALGLTALLASGWVSPMLPWLG
ncbi:glycosyltransferase family 2 protein [Kitasatospora viridis]|uniref:Cellulose synthase (UDP-forming) n=1 Tax=Kitasatospora viridis TaxID=281105 RepID=A0A561TU11_9ACTN|nr:cellulose synthase catalytic subunit [Kitasatospora viridis]TWF90564.1 cellulose synthase (UDP-forming) [Kitasatospora viridis]